MYMQARLKYLVDEWGVDKFRSVVEQYMGKRFQDFKPLPAWKFEDYLGWHEQGDGKLFYGVYVQVRHQLCRLLVACLLCCRTAASRACQGGAAARLPTDACSA